MKILKPDSQLHRLISLLSVCGEFPVKSLDLLGNKRHFVKKFLGDLAKETVISFDEVDKELSEYYSRYLIKQLPRPCCHTHFGNKDKSHTHPQAKVSLIYRAFDSAPSSL